MCIVFFIIECVYWYLRVILSSMFVVESLYASFLRSSFLCIHFAIFESEMSDLLLGTLGHCPFHHYIHYWCDFTPCLTRVDDHFSSYIHCFAIILIIACDSSHSLSPIVLFLHWHFQVWYFPCIIFAYLIISLICFIVSLLILYSHRAL